MGQAGAPCRPSRLPNSLITLRNAQVRRISWVRGVRPVRERYEWPPHDTAPDRPPVGGQWTTAANRLLRGAKMRKGRRRGALATSQPFSADHLILASRNSTCFLATGSYFFLVSFSVIVREFFRVT